MKNKPQAKSKSQAKRAKATLPKTMICLVLDRSGSMSGRESDVIGGVNTFIKEQQALPNPACMALVRFDSSAIERFRPMQDLKDFQPLTPAEYVPNASTPLLDAVGQTINALEEDWKREKPDNAIMVIVTDGQENSSREFSKAKIKEMIEAREKSGKWAFIYLGANVDAFSEGMNLGISTANTAGYKNTGMGTQAVYATLSANVSAKRATGDMLRSFSGSAALGGDIGEDGKVKTFTTTPAASSNWTPPAE